MNDAIENMLEPLRWIMVVYYDHCLRLFNIDDPILDDRRVTDRTVELQETGRNVTIWTITEPVQRDGVPPNPIKFLKAHSRGYGYSPVVRW